MNDNERNVDTSLSVINVEHIKRELNERIKADNTLYSMYRGTFKSFTLVEFIDHVVSYFYLLSQKSYIKEHFKEKNYNYLYQACVYLICSHYLLDRLEKKIQDFIQSAELNSTFIGGFGIGKDKIFPKLTKRWVDFLSLTLDAYDSVDEFADYYICLAEVDINNSSIINLDSLTGVNNKFAENFDSWYNSGAKIKDIKFNIILDTETASKYAYKLDPTIKTAEHVFNFIKDKLLDLAVWQENLKGINPFCDDQDSDLED